MTETADRSSVTDGPSTPETRMVFAVFPNHTNHYHTLFGGTAMAWMDQAAFICATRLCRENVVTVHFSEIDFSEIDFRQPVPEDRS